MDIDAVLDEYRWTESDHPLYDALLRARGELARRKEVPVVNEGKKFYLTVDSDDWPLAFDISWVIALSWGARVTGEQVLKVHLHSGRVLELHHRVSQGVWEDLINLRG